MKHEQATMTVPEAAKFLGIARGSAYEAVRRGDLPTLRIGKRILISKAALDRLLNRDVRDPKGESK